MLNSVMLDNEYTIPQPLMLQLLLIERISDVAKLLSYKTKTTYFLKTKTGQAKT